MQSAADARLFESFLYEEARLMDTNSYDEWFALWADGGTYWVPCNDDDVDPAKGISLIYETSDKIEDRVLRLKSKFAHAQSPRSRLMRVVSNIVIERSDESEIGGTSQFVLGEIRGEASAVIFGRNYHLLVRTPDGLRMKKKKVVLLNNDSTIGNLTFLI